MAKKIKMVISGGGTGGHIYPGIAIANELKKIVPDVEITFVGVKNRIEAKVVPREGYPLKTIHVQYFSRKIGIKTITFFFSLKIGFIQSFLFLLRYKPDVVIGTGGFVSGPVVYAACLLRIPTLIQEQNSYPGITTRLLAPRVKRIHLAFEEAIKYLHKVKDRSKFRITGNPVRMSGNKSERSIALENFNLKKNQKTLFLFGGSQGAAALNEALLNTLPLLRTDIQVIWQTGEPDYLELKSVVEKLKHKIYIQPFIYNMADAYCAADLAFCRAGAITIAELMQMAVPSILVPYPNAAEGHQEKNARVLVKANAAEMILQQDLHPTVLKATIERLMYDKEKLSGIKKNCEKFYFENAAKEIAKSILELIT
jgi:UDP-N-acetylglucosamine--N-acetylmuramyl-(pentapeptide) pyrophosphoryl-undecaprenol N-acetylglucosamine transferase